MDFPQTVESWRDALVSSFNHAFGQILDKAPNVVGMVIVLVVGYIAARVLDRVASALSDSLGLQTAAERSGLLDSMRQVGINRSVSWIIGRITFWLTMCVFLTAAFNILDLPTLTTAMETLVGYIPKLLVATVVVVIGLLIATFLRGVVATSADRVGVTYAEHLANGVYYVLALMTFIAAFDQLGFQFELLQNMILIAFVLSRPGLPWPWVSVARK